jgi:thiamine biosynthesis lipoprotein
MHDVSFPSMGSRARLIVADGGPRLPPARSTAAIVRAEIEDFEERLSRFRPDSELSALNRDTRERVPASDLLRLAVRAGIEAATRTHGLVDPTVLPALERAGYAASRTGAERVPLASLLRDAPPRRPAGPCRNGLWRQIRVGAAHVVRPAGVTIDLGGVGKGLAADIAAERLAAYPRFVVDCGGDLRLGGTDPGPREVLVEHPFTGEVALRIETDAAAVATSGIGRRAWRTTAGPAQHLIDPSTGRPAWTGLVAVTALAPTALEAETLAKAALLCGPAGARSRLAEQGGVLFTDDGEMRLAGPLARRRLRVRLPVRAAA